MPYGKIYCLGNLLGHVLAFKSVERRNERGRNLSGLLIWIDALNQRNITMQHRWILKISCLAAVLNIAAALVCPCHSDLLFNKAARKEVTCPLEFFLNSFSSSWSCMHFFFPTRNCGYYFEKCSSCYLLLTLEVCYLCGWMT